MKATLTFELPAESQEHDNALRGADYRGLVEDLLNELRSITKYGAAGDFGGVELADLFKSSDGAAKLREAIYKECQERDLPIT